MSPTVDPELVQAVAASLRGDGAVALLGGRGAGRTTALRAVAAEAGLRGRILHVTGRGGFADQPMASLGPAGRDGPAAAVSALSDDRPVVLVDDPHLMHPMDLAVLAEAAEAGARLAVAATTEAVVPAQLAAMLRELPTVRLRPLDEPSLAALASRLLEDRRVDASDLAALDTATGSRPGLVRRALREAAVTVEGDLAALPWTLGGTPGALAWRRERVPEGPRHQACRLVARDELTAREIATVVGADVVEAVLASGLVAVDEEMLALRDPLLAATLRDVDCRTHESEDAAVLVDALGDRVVARLRDRWRVAAGEPVPDRVRAAVVTELVDEGRPRDALVHAIAGGDDPQLVLARARARAAAGEVDAAIGLTAAVVGENGAEGGSDDQRQHEVRRLAAILLGDLLWFRRGDADAALSALEAAGDDVEATAIADLMRLALGDPLHVSEESAAHELPPLARQLLELRLVLAGAVARADDLAPVPDAPHPAGVPVQQRALTNRAMAAMYASGPLGAAPLVAEQLVDAVAGRRPGALALALYGRAEIERMEGRLVDAERTVRAAIARARVDDEAGLLGLLTAMRASLLAELGRITEAGGTLAGLEFDDLRGRLMAAPAVVRVTATQDRDRAADVAADAVAGGIAAAHEAWAVEVALHAARVGLGDVVNDLVATLADVEAATVRAGVGAVHAFTSTSSATARRDAADAMAAVGRRRVAAELLLGHESVSETDRRRAAALLDGLGPPNPSRATRVDGLTDRERQVATLVAEGRTSKDVASALDLSVRTVDNHLRRVYHKLGLEGRDQLAHVLAG